MNEQKIREIANASSNYAESTVAYCDVTENGPDYLTKMMKTRDLKFAELIVRECADVCKSSNYEFGTIFDKMVKDHFGIEE